MSTTQETYGPHSAGRPMTVEEFEAPGDWDENYVYELVDGVLVVNPAPEEGERGPNELLGYWLRVYREQHPKGSALNYTLNEHMVRTQNLRRADRVIWAGLGRMPNVRKELPTIVIEFVSRGRRDQTRDYEEKRADDLQAGIAEYWIIDRFARTMTVVRGPAESPAEEAISEDTIYTTPLLPGFELPLANLLAEADMLEQSRTDTEN